MKDHGYRVGPDGTLNKTATGAVHDMARKQMAVDVRKGYYGAEGDPKKQVPPPAPRGEDSEPAQQPHYEDAAEVVLKKIASKKERVPSPMSHASKRHMDEDDAGLIAHLGNSKRMDKEHAEHARFRDARTVSEKQAPKKKEG